MVANNYFPQVPITPLNVGGKATVWQPSDQILTRSNNTTAYAAGQAIGSTSACVFSFTNFCLYQSGSGLLIGARVGVNGSGIATTNMGSLLGYIYQASPTGAVGVTDGVAYPTLYADDAIYLGTLSFTTWNIGGSGSDTIYSYGSPLISQQHIIGPTNNRNAYMVLVASAASGATLAQAKIFAALSAVWD
jgi:hypothetical protein